MSNEIALSLAGAITTIAGVLAWVIHKSVSALIESNIYLQNATKAKHEQVDRLEKEFYSANEKFTKILSDYNHSIIPVLKGISDNTKRIIKSTNA